MNNLFSRKPTINYIEINGVRLFTKHWQGRKEPVVLLHGGLSSTDSFDYKLTPYLKGHEIFGYDRTAHGRSEFSEGYYHFEYQVKECISYLEKVVKKPSHLIGWSDGAIIALIVAISRPELVKSIVSIGGNFHWDCGLSLNPADISITEEDKAKWINTSPIPVEKLPEIINKAFEVWQKEPNLTKSDLAKIQCPVLVLASDDEVFTTAHTIELYESLPDGRLAIVPGTSHSLPKEKPELVGALINDFYNNLNFPQTRTPMRRKEQIEKIYGVHNN